MKMSMQAKEYEMIANQPRLSCSTCRRGPVELRDSNHRTMLLLLILLALLWPLVAVAPAEAAPLADCLGETRSLILSSGMPYTPVRVQGRSGFFVVDLGSDGSAISPGGFLGGLGPQPLPGSTNRFGGLDFFGPWPPLTLKVQDHSGIRGPLPQAGLIGTDLLQGHVLTLDYAHGLLHRADRAGFCSDGKLLQAGFRPLSNLAAAQGGPAPTIPTVPVRIGTSMGVAQVDTGYDDGLHPPSLNINRAWFEQLRAAGLRLQRWPAADLSLSTCAGVAETVRAYRLPPGEVVELVGSDGTTVRRLEGVTLGLKESPAAARRCGGIGTWTQPAGQLGASFVNDGTLVVDPFRQRLWFRPAAP
jgi:hypothetical protein